MRGDQLARQWRVIRAIEASPGGLTVAEIANFPSTLEALQAAGFPLYTEKVEKANRWAFVDTFKLKIPPSFHAKSQSSPRRPYRISLPKIFIWFNSYAARAGEKDLCVLCALA